VYAGVEGVAPRGDGLAVALADGDRAVVYRTDARGRGRRALFETDAVGWLPSDALVAVPGGFVLSVYRRGADDPHLYALDADGDVRWTYALPDAQDARVVGTAPDGDLFVVGVGAEGTVAARLSPDGAERWRRTVTTSDLLFDAAAAVGDGLALALRQYVGEVGDEQGADDRDVQVRALRLDGAGDEVWTERVAVVEVEDGGVRATALAGLPDGRVSIGLARGAQRLDGGTRTEVLVLNADGAAERSVVVGRPYETTTWVTHLLAPPDARLVVVAAVGPERLGGYGGDDFDVLVSSVGLDRQAVPR
jgi:outer membrane protein assembly factor BamB